MTKPPSTQSFDLACNTPLSKLKTLTPTDLKYITQLLQSGQMDIDPTVLDLLLHKPRKILDWREIKTIENLFQTTQHNTEEQKAQQTPQKATLLVTIDEHIPPRRGTRMPYTIKASDETGTLDLTFFGRHTAYLKSAHPVGEQRAIYGTVRFYKNKAQMPHPEKIMKPQDFASHTKIEAVYTTHTKLTQSRLRAAILTALDHLPECSEWQDKQKLDARSWPDFKTALTRLHAPETPQDTSPTSTHMLRLAYDEALAHQLMLCLARISAQNTIRNSHPSHKKEHENQDDRTYCNIITQSLPFQLTTDQTKTLNHIKRDLSHPSKAMIRLVQGDVGSGKTVVALLAIAEIFAQHNDKKAPPQSAIMAPTELLARQHYDTITRLTEQTDLKTTLLTGKETGKKRNKILEELKSGHINILIGTQALIQPKVIFNNLKMIVIDEQHRFGVNQRLTLANKGQHTHTLLLSATPIPRSLAMTLYGDMDISEIKTKPQGRKPITTTIHPLSGLGAIIARLENAVLNNNAKAYWICPLIESDDNTEEEDACTESADAAAITRFESLKPRFSTQIGLLHGKMKQAEKDAIMQDFHRGKIRVLVSTTVVEVGVDVPDATIMIIENAERFGLAQLHQLRGRVGRSDLSSFCLLLTKSNSASSAHKRLNILKNTQDGFLIAEEDLKLRGPGDVLGLNQSGAPDFRILDLDHHMLLLSEARTEAKFILDQDPVLSGIRGQALRTLLGLFHHSETPERLKAG